MNHSKPNSDVERVLQRIRALTRGPSRSVRDTFWLEGVRHFVEACDARLDFEAVVYSPVLLQSDLAEMLVRRLRARGILTHRISPEQFRSVSRTERASGIGAIARARWTPLGLAPAAGGLCWMVVEDLRAPGNFGTILRTAEACGVAGIVVLGTRCDPFAPDVLRASMGGVFRLALVQTTYNELAGWVALHNVQLVGLSPEAGTLWTEAAYDLQASATSAARPVALAVGDERCGLSPQLRAICTSLARLPIYGRADSLNVGVAAGVMLYELVRRRLVLGTAEPESRFSALDNARANKRAIEPQ